MKKHPLCTDTECSPTVLALPISNGLKMEWAELQTRRHFLGRIGKDMGWAAVASLASGDALVRPAHGTETQAPRPSPETLRLPNFAPKAQRAIYLFMSGGPPQMALFDYKPKLAALYDTDMPDSVRGAQRLTGMSSGQSRFPVAPSHWQFKQYGKQGAWISDLLPYTSRM